MLGIKLKYWIAVLLVPIVVNILVAIPSPWAIQEDSVWIGFFGNYAGGIVGAFVALIIAKRQTDIALNQLNEERALREMEKAVLKEEEEKVRQKYLKIIHLFIYEEIKTNIKKLPTSYVDALLDWSLDRLHGSYHGNYTFVYTTYNENKYDLIRYDDPQIEEVVDIYRIFKLIESNPNVTEMSKDVASYCATELTSWREYFNKH